MLLDCCYWMAAEASEQLGNYLGALKNWVKLQDTAESGDRIYYSVVGLHAITLPQQPDALRKDREDILATLLAVGLDPQRCTIFHQDQVSSSQRTLIPAYTAVPGARAC